jgi:phosphohistidine swiveling domain-containing protein
MPGMMDTVLNLGLNQETVLGLAEKAGKRFALDCYRRFLAMFGEVVLGIERDDFEFLLEDAKQEFGVSQDSNLTIAALEMLCLSYRQLIEDETNHPMIDDPLQQLAMAIVAVFASWDNERARAYRKAHNIPHWWGTAVNVQAMVFGNLGDDSCTGVVFSRNVASGKPGLYGEFLVNAQGEDVVAGVRTPQPIAEMKKWNSKLYEELNQEVKALERQFNDVVDVEFTVEQGRLFILQSRVAKRTPAAAVSCAVHFVWDKRWAKDEALERVSREQIEALTKPAFDAKALETAMESNLLAKGLPASPGAATGKVARSSEQAVQMADQGMSVVLVRPDTSPDDLPGMLASVAIVTETGGATSHAAVVARELGKPAVVGVSSIKVYEGQTVSVDGQTGAVMADEVKFAEAERTKEVNIFLRWVEQTKPKTAKPRLALELVEQSTSVNQLLNDFYLCAAMTQAAEGSALSREAEELKSRVHQQTAELIAAYITVAVAGELRHAGSWSHTQEVRTKLERFGVQYDDCDRRPAQMSVVQVIKDMGKKDKTKFFSLAVELFENGHWRSCLGGPAWARIAKAPLLFLSGELSSSVFADHAFDLQHNTVSIECNGGTIFDKHPMLSGNLHKLYSQLEVKKYESNVLNLHRRLSQICNQWSPQVADLFQKGDKLGLWTAKHNQAA